MSTIFHKWRAQYLSITFIIFLLPSLAFAQRLPEAENFVDAVANKTLNIIRNDNLSLEGKKQAFGKILTSSSDYRKLAGFVLGRYARTLTPSQKDEYIKLFLRFAENVYVVRLTPFRHAVIKVTGSDVVKMRDGHPYVAIVKSKLLMPQSDNREGIDIAWQVIQNPVGVFKFFDINVAGIWIAQEQRQVFTSILDQNQGSFDALRAILEK